MPPALLIIADDLTGANDTGVQFAKQGIRVIVSIRHEQLLQTWADDCQVLVVNTESRHVLPEPRCPSHSTRGGAGHPTVL